MTWSNVTRTLADAHAVWRQSRATDVVHIHSALAPEVTLVRAGLLAAMARLRGARVIVHAHGGLVKLWLTTRPRRVLVRLALWPADRVVAVSEGGREALVAALGHERVLLIDNAVDLSAFGPPGPPHDPPRILYVGVLTPRKGILDLFDASEILRARRVDHEIVLVGGPPPEGLHAEEEVRRAAPPATRFLGPRPHETMPDLYVSVDLFCLPSWWEAMPLSVLEAMASGLAVVATAVGDVPRVVRQGETGLLVPPRDPLALAEALEWLLRDADLRRRTGMEGRRLMEEQFSTTRATHDIDRLYGSIGPPRRRSGSMRTRSRST